jgi:hypothetical protein
MSAFPFPGVKASRDRKSISTFLVITGLLVGGVLGLGSSRHRARPVRVPSSAAWLAFIRKEKASCKTRMAGTSWPRS